MAGKVAAIDEELLQRPLGEISASQFLQVLGSMDQSSSDLVLLPDKKKYELWVDEAVIDKINVADLLEKIRGEKKKLELEKRTVIEHFKKYTEFEFDPEDLVTNPAIREQLVAEISTEVMRRLGR